MVFVDKIFCLSGLERKLRDASAPVERRSENRGVVSIVQLVPLVKEEWVGMLVPKQTY